MECLTSVFDKLWEVRGSGTSDPECIAFAYKSLDDIEWTGLHQVLFDEVKTKHIKDWSNAEDWIYDLRMGLSLEDVFQNHVDDIYSEEIQPCHLIKNKNDLQVLVLKALRSKSERGELELPGIACTEIINGDKTLLLLFDDCDAWGLGHGNYIEVVEDFSDLTEENGYYSFACQEYKLKNL